MTRDQRIVATGAASGVLSMALAVWVLHFYIPAPVVSSVGDRLAYALGACVAALLPFFAMLITVGNERFLSKAIDPTLHKENHMLEVNGRVADNTLQQSFVFVVGTLALSTLIPASELRVIWALAIVHIIARLIFWVGYRKDPLLRAPGMAATAYMNLGILLTVLYLYFF